MFYQDIYKIKSIIQLSTFFSVIKIYTYMNEKIPNMVIIIIKKI